MAKNNNQKTTCINSEYGKLPPQSIEIEEVVIGALLLEKNAIDKIELDVDDFYSNKHQLIYQAILNLKEARNPIDMFTVTEELKKMNAIDDIGGAYSIMLLTTKVSSASSIEFHASIIKQKAIARKLITLSSEVQTMAYNEDTDVADVLEFMETNFTNISTGSSKADASDMNNSINETLEYMRKVQERAESGLTMGIPTGLNELDKALNGGWSAPDLIILGGRPSMGKTQFAVSFAKAATQANFPVLFISIEMTKIQLILRMITENDSIDFFKIKTGQLTMDEWMAVDTVVNEIRNLDLFIADDYTVKYIQNIKALARKMKRQGKLSLMIVDYIGLIKTNMKFGTRDLEIGYITGELKSLCKELSIPIIALNQLNRAEKGAKVRDPRLEDLRESGNLEQDADVVIMPHRPDYYDPDAIDKNGMPWKQRGKLVIAKNREGERGIEVLFKHDKAFKKITDDGDFLKEVLTHNVNMEMQPNFGFYEQSDNEKTPF